MGTLTKTFVFTPGTPAVASQVNADLDILFAWVNTNAIWADGSIAFTGVPTGPATDPTTANQLVRKHYVDNKIQGGVTGVTVNASSQGTLTFPTPFANSCVTFIGQVKPQGGTLGGFADAFTLTKTNVSITCLNQAGAAFNNGTVVTVNWIALGT